MKAFLTGSRVYGQPTKKSDIDLVVPIDAKMVLALVRFADSSDEVGHVVDGLVEHESGGRFTPSLRFGKLNLILVTEPDEWKIWTTGTKWLMDHTKGGRKISRREAVKFFDRMRYQSYTADDSGEHIDWDDKPELEEDDDPFGVRLEENEEAADIPY